jgi:hypothetical protein
MAMVTETVTRDWNQAFDTWERCQLRIRAKSCTLIPDEGPPRLSSATHLAGPWMANRNKAKPDMVEHASAPSYSGGWGRRLTWAQDFKASLGDIVKSCLKKKKKAEKKKNRRKKKKLLHGSGMTIGVPSWPEEWWQIYLRAFQVQESLGVPSPFRFEL